MHTTETKSGVTFIHNGNYFGPVKIVNGENTIEIPFEDILEFVGEYVRSERISKLEQMNTEELLGA